MTRADRAELYTLACLAAYAAKAQGLSPAPFAERLMGLADRHPPHTSDKRIIETRVGK